MNLDYIVNSDGIAALATPLNIIAQKTLEAMDAVDEFESTIQDHSNRIADLEYVPIEIESLTVSTSSTGTNTEEIGATVSRVTMSWVLNTEPQSGQAVYAGNENIATYPAATRTTSFNYTFSENTTFKLRVSDAGSPSNPARTIEKNVVFSFYNKVYWGASASGTIDSAFILALSGYALSNTKARTFTVNAGSGQYIWYALPKRLGTCSFNVGGFDGGFELIATVSFTNRSGYTEDYYVYRSTNANLGSTTVKVS